MAIDGRLRRSPTTAGVESQMRPASGLTRLELDWIGHPRPLELDDKTNFCRRLMTHFWDDLSSIIVTFSLVVRKALHVGQPWSSVWCVGSF